MATGSTDDPARFRRGDVFAVPKGVKVGDQIRVEQGDHRVDGAGEYAYLRYEGLDRGVIARQVPAGQRTDVVTLRCGVRRHRYPPRVGEVFGGRTGIVQVRRACDRLAGGVYLVLPTSLRFPCGGRLEDVGRCRADWNVETARLEAAYRRAVVDRQPELVFPFDF
jgi:hypothetical protein